MIFTLARRMLCEPDKRVLAKFVWNFGWKGCRAVGAFNRRLKDQVYIPAFLFISVTDRCNLRCQGCWVTPADPPRIMPPEMLDAIIREQKKFKSYFFGILGGEPLLYDGLFEVIARHPDCYFQLFTNGMLLDDAVAARLRKLGNVTPLISIEGNPAVSDVRRGGDGVHAGALSALAACRRQRLITGVATSVCKSNLDDLVSWEFIHQLADLGVHYLWYYIYRPVGPNPAPELALSAAEILRLRQFMVAARGSAPLMIVDAYWDHQGRALCPAATGISHHVNSAGDIEPCPPIQFAADRLDSNPDLRRVFTSSQFLADFRETARTSTRGCILLEDPARLASLVSAPGVRDSSGRGTGHQELCACRPLPGHHLPGQEVPERHWLYRLAKKYWFFGFGAYG